MAAAAAESTSATSATTFDTEFLPRVTRSLKEIKNSFNAADEDFLRVWNARVAEHGEWKLDSFVPAESPSFLEEFKKFIELHGSAHINQEVVGIAVLGIAALAEFILEASGFVAHYYIRDSQDWCYAQEKAHPQEETHYWAMDQKDFLGGGNKGETKTQILLKNADR